MYKISLDLLFENSNLKSILSTNKNSDLNKENNDKEKINYLLSNEVVIGSDKKVPSNNKKDELDELSLFTKLSIFIFIYKIKYIKIKR